jgi:hypothetical protein
MVFINHKFNVKSSGNPRETIGKILTLTRGCMHRRFIIKKTWLSVFNNSKKTKCCLVFKNQGKKSPKPETLGFLETTCIGWGRNQKTNEEPGRNQSSRKPSVMVGWTFELKKHCAVCIHPLHS